MAGYTELIKSSNAYKLLAGDKKAGRLSHAYMVCSSDKTYLRDYLKLFAKLIACDTVNCDGACRVCKGIEDERLTDIVFYPKNREDKISTEDINDLVDDSYIRPYELPIKLYIIEDVAKMNTSSQNKLLKTLEEPPKNVYLLIGTSSENAVLPTIKSRIKKLEIPMFCADDLYLALKDKCLDYTKLRSACKASDGTYGNALELYSSEKFATATALAGAVLKGLASSRDVLKVVSEINASGVDLEELLDALEVLLNELLVYFTDKRMCESSPNADLFKELTSFNRASVIYALDRVKDAKIKKYFNGNDIMVMERLLLQILEGKYKWRKL
jgi:DNA polymerase III gamma/tau subunit